MADNKDNKKVYPYLGRNYIDRKPYVVLFTEEETGIVVANETNAPNIKFGAYTFFDESKFEVLPPNECVRISN